MLSGKHGDGMTPTEYARTAAEFHKRHKVASDRLLAGVFSLSAARMGKKLEGPTFEVALAEHRDLLRAMLDLSGEVQPDA